MLVVRQSAPPLKPARTGSPTGRAMNKSKTIQIGLAVVLLAGAGVLTARFLRNERDASEGQVYYYDLSEQKLFAAPRNAVPPIRGLNDDEADAVRAMVVSPTGNPREKKNIRIAYLEKYTPELKAKIEALRRAEAAGQSTIGIIGHGMVPQNTLVRRVTDDQWVPLTSPAGERIVSEWNVPGPDGRYPVVCAP